MKVPAHYDRYNEELLRFVNDGYATEITADDLDNKGAHDMPHHEVVSSSAKWRIVFDCSAKERGSTSLNDHLLRGPNLNPELVALLLKFRLHSFAISADIAKAYMRIAVHGDDQPLFRFLWKGPGDSRIRTFQMTRVTWGAAPSGFLLAATIREHFRRAGGATEELSANLYADDFLYSCQSEREIKDFIDLARATLRTAGMELAKWKSSSSAALEHLRATGVDAKDFDAQSDGLFKVLGISWNTDDDTFHFRTPDATAQVESGLVSRRTALSIIASAYDPLGWIVPFSVRGKLMIQRLWQTDLRWNDPIPDAIRRDLKAWVNELALFRSHSIPRRFCTRREAAVSYHLHMFGDASQKAYAAIAYIEYR